MHLSIYFNSLFFVCVTLYSQLRILSNAKAIDAPKSPPRTVLTRISARNTNGGDQVFTISTDTEGRPSQTCQCVLYYLCDTQDVYYPTADESHITCGKQQACCKRPLTGDDLQTTTTNPKETNNEICVAASQCNQTALATNYGLGAIIIRGLFSSCQGGKIQCPIDQVLPNVVSPAPPDISATPSSDNCTCTSPISCNADYGQNILREKMFQCDSAEVCCPNDLIRTPLDSPAPQPQAPTTNTECGIRNEVIQSKLGGATDTISGEFPWMILLLERVGNEEKVKCGGSLVQSDLVLTAAHCVDNANIHSLIVRAGEYNLALSSELESYPHQDRQVKKITIHTNFYRKLILHDLALIQVSEPFQYTPNVKAICLPLNMSPFSPDDTGIYNLDKCIASGWGSKESVDPTVRNTLGKLELKIIPSSRCVEMLRKSALGPKFFLHDSLICAMGKPGTDTCKGDGGGPLICPLRSNPNKYVQVGVIAGGLTCNSPFPSLYASLLLNNAAWITEEILFQTTFPK